MQHKKAPAPAECLQPVGGRQTVTDTKPTQGKTVKLDYLDDDGGFDPYNTASLRMADKYRRD